MNVVADSSVLINLKELLDKLLCTANFRISNDLYSFALREVNE